MSSKKIFLKIKLVSRLIGSCFLVSFRCVTTLIWYFSLRRRGIRYIGIYMNEALGPQAWITHLQLAFLKSKNIDSRSVLMLGSQRPANPYLSMIHKRFLTIEIYPRLRRDIFGGGWLILKWMGCLIEFRYPNGTDIYLDSQRSLKFMEQEITRGWDLLQRIGIQKTDRLVPVHTKDEYYYQVQRGIAKEWDSYRDTPFSVLEESIQFLKAQGYKVIRMGAYEEIPTKSYLSLNCFTSEERAFLDLFVQSVCEFSINGPSGIATIPYVFGKPILFHNLIPLGENPPLPRGILLPKLLRKRSTGQVLGPAELQSCRKNLFFEYYGFYRYKSLSLDKFQEMRLYEGAGIDILSNSPDDVLNAVKEMIALIDQTLKLDEQDQKYQRAFKMGFPTGHQVNEMRGYISPSFLRKYHHDLGIVEGKNRAC